MPDGYHIVRAHVPEWDENDEYRLPDCEKPFAVTSHPQMNLIWTREWVRYPKEQAREKH